MIEIKNFCKKFDNLCVFDNLNFKIEQNKITVILGESGCGKTTLLNALSGLIDYSGEILGMPEKLSVVFQENRLVDCLTVKENLNLVNADENCLSEQLEEFGLSEKINAYPKELSGGMARRVAILRALRYDAELLLMDEPFINLDLKLKFNLINKVKNFQQQKNATIIMVTHDIKEAVKMADRIIVFMRKENSAEIIKDIKRITKNTEKQLFELLSGQSE